MKKPETLSSAKLAPALVTVGASTHAKVDQMMRSNPETKTDWIQTIGQSIEAGVDIGGRIATEAVGIGATTLRHLAGTVGRAARSLFGYRTKH